MLRTPSLSLFAATLVLAGTSAVRADKCTAAKLKAIGKKEAALLNCQSRVAAKNDTSGLMGCERTVSGKFSTAFGKAGSCAGDEMTCENVADACESNVSAPLADTFPSKCEATKRKAAGKLANGELRCYAKAALIATPPDSGCITRAQDKFSAVLTKVGGCPDGGSPQVLVEDTCVAPAVALGSDGMVRGVCPTTNTTSTTTIHPSSTTTTSPSGTVRHYEYVFPDGSFAVYDMDHGHQLVKTVALPQTTGLRGAIANAPTHSLYISYGGDGNGQNGTPTLLKYDLLTDTVVWTHLYAIGIDSMSITPDGSLIYMPSGELATGGTWYVLRADTGDVLGTITGPTGPHNTIVSLDGAHVYLGGRSDNFLEVAASSNDQVFRQIGPLQNSVRPFTINGRETVAYITITGLRGFQIGDITTGQVVRTVTFTGPNVSAPCGSTCPSAPSHGISLSPDERELYVVDWPNYVHVFDVSGVPAQAPQQVADITLTPSMNHFESPCLYDCLADGWLQHSRDGRFVYVGDQGDVIDTATRRAVTNLSALSNTRKMIEIDWSQGVPVFAATARASVGYVR